jgi:hypothetical protein
MSIFLALKLVKVKEFCFFKNVIHDIIGTKRIFGLAVGKMMECFFYL